MFQGELSVSGPALQPKDFTVKGVSFYRGIPG